MYDYIASCMVMYGYLWLWRVMYGYVASCMFMYGYAGLCIVM